MSDEDKKDDSTHVGGAPPAVPKLPSTAAPAGGGDSTHVGGAPPVIPQKAPPSPPPVRPAPPPPAAADADDEGEETVAIGQATTRTPFSLQRVQPPGHAGIIYLSRDTYLLGRKQGADLTLFSPNASREHARLERRTDGWYVAPLEGRTVIANGTAVSGSVRLEHKMRLKLGGDELIFFDETAAPAATAAPGAAAATGSSRRTLWVAVIVALLAAAAVAAWVILSRG